MIENFWLSVANAVMPILGTHLIWTLILCALVQLVLRGWKSASATVRHRLLQLVLILAVSGLVVPLLPQLSIVPDRSLPAQPISIEQSAPGRPIAGTIYENSNPTPTDLLPAIASTRAADKAQENGSQTAVNGNSRLLLTLFVIWLTVSALMLLRVISRVLRAWKMMAEARAVTALPSDLQHLRLKTHPQVTSPLCLGLVRSTIVVPPDYPLTEDHNDTWQQASRAVLRHEAGHVVRRDNLDGLLAEFARALLWFNPSIHWLVYELAQEREAACDDHARKTGINVKAYSRHLLELVQRQSKVHNGVHMLGILNQRGMMRRFERLVDHRCSHHTAMPGVAVFSMVVTGLLITALMIAAMPRLVWAETAEQPPRVALSDSDQQWVQRFRDAVAAKDTASTSSLIAAYDNDPVSAQALHKGLIAAIEAKNRDLVLKLFDLGADWRGHDGTAGNVLSRAVNWPEGIDLLLQRGVDPNNVADSVLQSPLANAVLQLNYESVELLLAAGADIDADHGGAVPLTALMRIGVTSERLEMLKHLIEKGADVNQVIRSKIWTSGSSGNTPLIQAVASGNPSVVSLLLEQGADPNLAVNRTYTDGAVIRMTPMAQLQFRIAAYGEDPSKTRILQLLEQAGAELAKDELISQILNARQLNRVGQEGFVRLTLGDREQIMQSLLEIAPDVSPDPDTIPKEEMAWRAGPEHLSVSVTTKLVPVSDNRQKSYLTRCDKNAETDHSWQCSVFKVRYRQRWGSEHWMTVTGEVSEQTANRVARFAVETKRAELSREGLLPAYIASSVSDENNRYIVALRDPQNQSTNIQAELIDYQGELRLIAGR